MATTLGSARLPSLRDKIEAIETPQKVPAKKEVKKESSKLGKKK